MKKAAIYTAIFGNYDKLNEPAPQDANCDFICFTDVKLPEIANGWRIVQVLADRKLHPRMQAKWFKLMSHVVFPNGRLAWKFALRAKQIFNRPQYESTIWCDGGMRIKGASFARDIADLVKDDAIAVFKHPVRDCIFEEAEASASMRKYEGLPLKEQVEHYRQLGTLPHNGLFACGVIGRRASASQAIADFESAWWRENLEWTYQDQLSFAHLLGGQKISIAPINGSVWANQYFDLVEHNSNL